MILTCLFLVVCAGEGSWALSETEIYQPLRRDEVLVDDRGDVFILDYPKAVVHHFSSTGVRLEDIGFKGQGPGGLKAPWNIFLEGTRLFVFDRATNTISQYTSQGKFVRRLLLPKQGTTMEKVKGGWIYGEWLYSVEPNKPATLTLVDENFKNPVLVTQLKERGISSALNMTEEGNKRMGVYTPVGYTPRISVSPNGETAYVLEAQGLVLHVVDAASKKITATIRRNERPIPFDKDWAQAKLNRLKETYKVQIKPDFPEYFPVVRDFFTGIEGNLIFDRWRGNPEDNHYPLVLDPKGKELPNLDWGDYNRLVGQWQEFYYVTGFNFELEEAWVRRIPKRELAGFAGANPIEFDGSTGRTFNR